MFVERFFKMIEKYVHYHKFESPYRNQFGKLVELKKLDGVYNGPNGILDWAYNYRLDEFSIFYFLQFYSHEKILKSSLSGVVKIGLVYEIPLCYRIFDDTFFLDFYEEEEIIEFAISQEHFLAGLEVLVEASLEIFKAKVLYPDREQISSVINSNEIADRFCRAVGTEEPNRIIYYLVEQSLDPLEIDFE